MSAFAAIFIYRWWSILKIDQEDVCGGNGRFPPPVTADTNTTTSITFTLVESIKTNPNSNRILTTFEHSFSILLIMKIKKLVLRNRHERKLNTMNENGARSARPQRADEPSALPFSEGLNDI